MNRNAIKSAFYDDPEMLALLTARDEKEAQKIEEALNIIKIYKGEKGDVGATGATGATGIAGRDGRDGRSIVGPKGDKGEAGKDSVSTIQTETIREELSVSAELVKEIIKVMRTLPEKDRLDISQIRNAASFMKGGTKYKTEELMHGGGPTLVAGSGVTITTNANGTTTIAATGATIASETPVGAVNGVNLIYTVSHTPLFIIADSNFRISGQGYSYAAPTITMDALIPPVQFIQSYYAA